MPRLLPEKQATSWWKLRTPTPRSRTLIVGSVGSGKSTLGAALLESYHGLHPLHRIFIIDPKERFVPRQYETGRIFPFGFTARRHTRVDGVTVNAVHIRGLVGYRWPKDETVFLIQDEDKALEAFEWLYRNHDVRKPILIYNDESFDIHNKAGLVDPSFRKIIQMGREKGLGHITINQRPARIDRTLITESDYLYVGRLNSLSDRKRISEEANILNQRDLWQPMPKRCFWFIDQAGGRSGERFTITT